MNCRCGSPEIKDAPGTWFCGTHMTDETKVYSVECVRRQFETVAGIVQDMAEFRRGVGAACDGDPLDLSRRLRALLEAFPEPEVTR